MGNHVKHGPEKIKSSQFGEEQRLQFLGNLFLTFECRQLQARSFALSVLTRLSCSGNLRKDQNSPKITLAKGCKERIKNKCQCFIQVQGFLT